MDEKKYKLFKEGLYMGEEYLFVYNDTDYWISHDANGGSSLAKDDGTYCQDFHSLDELFQKAKLDGKLLDELYPEMYWGVEC
ncbi:hypothetical protein ACP0AK_01610 [Listeria ivanovii]|uniref:Uncharacterized protein n=1 Tax=Listeria ivanovii (strain ATCC BAA-678 / PAM 55) TaxID=881621 RepID=G2ZAK0_LISIP|nr:hypothetical protein [Listeria ivanovii]AHI55910.1 hypothetical protein AX25_07330 [Listeria ivanovii WSLC3009]AIS65352.1 hypothetical protein JL52_07195 [Listeria ivanovii subsp. ivanovii]MBC1759258.1 hypothetical protein [Listeria ivanovii]MBK3914491.1 hypothetical protein [Listeria ivanovii subsp. ivanovii]MBK3921611.1 hypothetical protein [Listeria ivanovii subsp. ivanovii]